MRKMSSTRSVNLLLDNQYMCNAIEKSEKTYVKMYIFIVNFETRGEGGFSRFRSCVIVIQTWVLG